MPGIAIPGIFAWRPLIHKATESVRLFSAARVIEDSAGGIRAAVAAGMTVVGLCAASHIREGHDLKLRDAGAVHLAHSWSDAERFALNFFKI